MPGKARKKVRKTARMTTDHDANITSFFGKDDVRVISDPEGYHVCQLAGELGNQKFSKPDNKMIVLGDLLDYTIAGSKGAKFGTDELSTLRQAKSNSFTSIKYCLDNQDKIKVLFGNRDLNKLKLLALGLITDDSGNYVKWWTERTTYLDAARDLITKLENGHNWAVSSMEKWKPFWNANMGSTPHWASNDPRLVSDTAGKMSCLERFYLIFGMDCAQGTISAQNNLFGVAQECGLYENIFGKYKDELTQLNNNYLLDAKNPLNISSDLRNQAELAAALVFTVFADALFGIDDPKPEKQFTGVLRKFFVAPNSYYCAYAELGDNLLTFSHGGMRKEFFTCKNTDGNLVNQVYENEQLKDMLSKSPTQKGGYTSNNAVLLSSTDIKSRIVSYNKEMKDGLIKLMTDYNILLSDNKKKSSPSAELLLNIIISVPYAGSEPTSCLHKHASPIMPGLSNPDPNAKYRIQPICTNDKLILYQFIGHGPLGFAPTFDKYTSGENGYVSYAINLDVSNSLFGQLNLLNKNRLLGNYSYVSVSYQQQQKTLQLLSNVDVSMESYDIKIINGGQSGAEPTSNLSVLPVSKITQIKIDNHNLLSRPLANNFFEHEKYNYQGQFEFDGKMYDLYITVSGFTVSLFAINTQTIKDRAAIFKGGKSIRRRHLKNNRQTATGKRQPMKFHIRRTHSLVRRRPQMKRTAKKL